MSSRNLSFAEHSLHFVRQLQQSHYVRDMAAAFSERLSQFFLGMSKALDQLAITQTLLDRVQIGSLHVLDYRDFQDFRVI
ncbi:hypothetical protein SAMN04488026_100739 [Aliiruegeria lutimaris]|uniref:Uncharacterized protein n=1 Tax=Aliiruegeria lutimaris TaxID=571298 RepID=A0A1G8NDQ9_9RHOB|nr:hypothetical protein SAMN04488026_100739 [Aliiruegeria lutimaris]